MRIAFLHILLFFSLVSVAQNYKLNVNFIRSPIISAELFSTVDKLQKTYADSVALIKAVKEVQNLVYERGYLSSKASLSIKDTLAQLSIELGDKLYLGRLDIDYPETFALDIPQGYDFDDSSLNQERLKELIDNYLNYLENRGYPFSSAQIQDYTISNDSLKGTLFIDPGPVVTIDSIVIKGFDKFSKNVLRYDLQFKESMRYSESYLFKIQELIRQVEYLKFSRPPAIAFIKNKTTLYLYTEEVRSNQIDGVIGLNTEEDGTTSFNGDFQLRLLNSLKKGEELKIRWRRPDNNIQSLDLGIALPYLFKTPFWLVGNLSIFRQDSSFVNTDIDGTLKYLLESGSFVSGGITYRSSNVLDSEGTSVADLGSFTTTAYKIGFELSRTDRIIIPTSGYAFTTYGITGNRVADQNSQNQYGWEFIGDYYLKLGSNHVIKLGSKTEALFGENLFRNELFRIGGLKTLRGFNEQSIFSSAYGIGTVEYRYMIGEFDYLTMFADGAYSENNSIDSFASNYLLGLGGGINFRTRGGIFSLFLAVGRVNLNPFDFRASKVHFGYVNRF